MNMIRNKPQKICLSLLAFSMGLISIPSSALTPNSPYLGANLGFAYHDYHEHLNDIKSRIDRDGPAARVFVGYQFNDLAGVELAYGRYHAVEFNLANALVNQRGHIRHEAIDLVGKVTVPIIGGVGLMGEAGAAYVNAHPSSRLEVPTLLKHGFAKDSFFTPVVGAALVFDADQGQVQVGVKHIEGHHRIRDINFAQVGATVALG
jgi:hypothetical protein